MGKKIMKLPSILKKTDHVSSSSWSWPSCRQPKTLSFRIPNNNKENTFKTINSTYSDIETPESFFTESPKSASFSTATDEGDPVETVIRTGLESDRLFFEPGETSSILEAKAGTFTVPFKDTVVLSMDSEDPYVDFRKSMEEMVEAYEVKEWEGLEELLCWYLRNNRKKNHGYIVGAFVDLLVSLALSSASSSTPSTSYSHSPSSPLSFYSSTSMPMSSPSPSNLALEQVKEEIEELP